MKTNFQIRYWAHMLDEAFSKDMLTEGKHWPEDYIKTAVNLIKQSPIGQQSWYTDELIQQDAKTFTDEFGLLSHQSSNLGLFMPIIRWFVEYSGTSREKYQEFIERKLDGIIAALLKIRNGRVYASNIETINMLKSIKNMSFAEFDKVANEVNSHVEDKDVAAPANASYEVIPIYSYEELHEKYGGPVTGYKGQSLWCHTNGQSTYNSWTKNGTQMFFVIQRKDWKDIAAPEQKPDSCYDEYGMSLIAILVDVQSNKLLDSTSRWNHVVLPVSGAADIMFESWQQLNKAVRIDVESICRDECKESREKFQQKSIKANETIAKILKNAKIITAATIPEQLRTAVTKVNIPFSVESIEDYAFCGCASLKSITIPDSVKSIEHSAFYYCTSLKSITIPDSVKSIGQRAFCGCASLNSITIPDSVKSIGNDAFNECTSLESINIPDTVKSIGDWAFYNCTSLNKVIFKGKTIDQVKAMDDYPWGIEDTNVITCEGSLNENKATYLQKYANEDDVNAVVEMFWRIRDKLSTPQNDIDWWIKKPFAELKKFVQNFDPSNKKQRRDASYKQQAIEDGAKLLSTRDGYEIWYVPTYEAMVTLGRFYKGRSAKWCVASDDPEFWFDNHGDSEFVVLVREHLKNDEFDKVAIEMGDSGRYFNDDDIMTWDLENNNKTFNSNVFSTAPELVHYAWWLFKDNGETRNMFVG